MWKPVLIEEWLANRKEYCLRNATYNQCQLHDIKDVRRSANGKGSCTVVFHDQTHKTMIERNNVPLSYPLMVDLDNKAPSPEQTLKELRSRLVKAETALQSIARYHPATNVPGLLQDRCMLMDIAREHDVIIHLAREAIEK